MSITFKIFPTANDIATEAGRGKRLYESNMAGWFEAQAERGYVVSGGELSIPESGLTLTIPAISVAVRGRLVEIYDPTPVLLGDDAENQLWIQLVIDLSGNATEYIVAVTQNGVAPANSVYIGKAWTESGNIVKVQTYDRDETPYSTTSKIIHEGTVELETGIEYSRSELYWSSVFGSGSWTQKNPNTVNMACDGAKTYVNGGLYHTGSEHLINTEYDLENDSWNDYGLEQLSYNQYSAITAIYDGYLYQLGGIRYIGSTGQTSTLVKTQRMDLDTGEWEQLNDLAASVNSRFHQQAVVYDDKIWFEKDDYGTIVVYDPSDESITEIGKLPNEASCMALVVAGGNLYAFGGLKSGAWVGTSYIWDSVNSEWDAITAMPSGLFSDSYTGVSIIEDPLFSNSYNLLQLGVVGNKIYMKRQLGLNFYSYDINTGNYTWENYAPYGSGSRIFSDGTKIWYIMEMTKEVCSYDPAENKWNRPVGVGSWGHNGKLYTLGSDNKMQVYEEIGKWTKKTETAPVINTGLDGNKNLCLITKISVIGNGKYLYLLNGQYNVAPYYPYLNFLVRYDTEEDEYEVLSTPPTSLEVYFALASTERYIYILGGTNPSTGVNIKIWRYDTIDDDWLELPNTFGTSGAGQRPALYAFFHDGYIFATKREDNSPYPVRLYRIDPVSGKNEVLRPSDLPLTSGANPAKLSYGNGRLYIANITDRGAYATPRYVYQFTEVVLPVYGDYCEAEIIEQNSWLQYDTAIIPTLIAKNYDISVQWPLDSVLQNAHDIFLICAEVFISTRPTQYTIRNINGLLRMANMTSGQRGEAIAGYKDDIIGIEVLKWLPKTLNATIIGG